ncbi:malto-oligosyltrehalose trehalohydrolase [Kushneria marisflavi]|uniref:Malto-oligosyltrehalose trehalohydrolase n=1 Tax=Kushneria marisflavi TaxID=157779 RepID=A0A240US65_9GAMM|nr:malto-oligosyltrehalose trehalohydrolase [Kushneria marisflavi]ART63882.1 malto-oligosyltrehalose trehalohydrolase [Kushneria marisflavi]RKD85594.1 maltooligosyl trehalose hydrolase [Kushneria marisflavi]
MSASVSESTGDRFSYRCHYGATVLDDHRTRFTLWAPDAETVRLELSRTPGGEPEVLSMEKGQNGHFALELECPPGAHYRYRISDDLAVPDPAARAQHEDITGPSVVIDPQGHGWKNSHWQGRPWHETVILEVHVGVLGGFDGVRKRLQDWAGMGITAIELMPVNEFPGARNWGYDGVLPYAVEASYGTPDQLKAMIDEAHGLGLMVFLDVVYNHFGPDGNYLPHYAGDFFTGERTPWGDEIDFERPQVRDFFIDNALMWVEEYRFDGLRFDAVHAINNDGFLREMSERIKAQVNDTRHIHLMLENERNSASLLESTYTAQWNDDIHNVLHALLTGEHEGYYADYCDHATDKLASALHGGFIFQGQNDRHGHSRGEPSGHLPPTAFIAFLQNHDQVGNRAMGERLISLVDQERLEAATALLLLCPMIPMLFMGEESGEQHPFLFFTDHRDELADAVREGRRSEFADFSHFKDEKTRAQIPDPNAVSTFEQSCLKSESMDDPEAAMWRTRYMTLLDIRHAEIIPRLPGTRPMGAVPLGEGAILAHWRMGDGTVLAIAVNLGKQRVSIDAPEGQRLYELGESDDATTLAPGAVRACLSSHL